MSNFSLSRKAEKVMPDTVTVDGIAFSVNPDCRNVLRIFRMLDDGGILPLQKPGLLARWFFIDDAPEDPVDAFRQFIINGREKPEAEKSGEDEPQQFCFEFDAEEIWVSFLHEYGVDLLTVPLLHWYRFIIMLSNLSENSPFQKKIKLRFIGDNDIKHLTGEEQRKIRNAREAAQLPGRLAPDEQETSREFESIWDSVGR